VDTGSLAGVAASSVVDSSQWTRVLLDLMLYFDALADLTLRVREFTLEFDILHMFSLANLASTFCLREVALPPTTEDRDFYDIVTSVTYDDVLSALSECTTSQVWFRHRYRTWSEMASMLVGGCVPKGFNIYLNRLVGSHEQAVADMMAERIGFVGSVAFAKRDLEGRWLVCVRDDVDHAPSIKYLPRPKRVDELRGKGAPSKSSRTSGVYAAHVRRCADALDEPAFP